VITAASPSTALSTVTAAPDGGSRGAGLASRRLLVLLAGTAGCWFLLDYAYYGNTISTPQIIALTTPHASQTITIALQLAIFAVAAVPGYALAVWRMDRIGHRRLQLTGFIMMGACFAVIGLIPGITAAVVPFLLAYGISYFFTEFGPNVTTFVLPGELFPTRFRATGHGISAGVGKLGAFIGVSLFPVLQHSLGLRGTLLLTAGISALGALLTLWLGCCGWTPVARSRHRSMLRPSQLNSRSGGTAGRIRTWRSWPGFSGPRSSVWPGSRSSPGCQDPGRQPGWRRTSRASLSCRSGEARGSARRSSRLLLSTRRAWAPFA